MVCAAARAADEGALTDLMSPYLAAELVRHGLWTPAQALGYALSRTDLYHPAYGVAALGGWCFSRVADPSQAWPPQE